MSLAENRTSKVCVIAIPVAGDRLCMHFGHCEQFKAGELQGAEKANVEGHWV